MRLHRQTGAAASVLTGVLDDPTGYGRIVRGKDDRVLRIVEHADADDEERLIREINTSIYCFRRGVLAPALRRLSPENAQGEYYLSDVVEVLADAGYTVVSLVADDPVEAAGVNDRAQLAVAEAELRDRTNERWMRRGVTMVDPERTYVDASVELAPDVTLFPGTILRGATTVATGAEIGPDAQLIDTTVGERAVVEYTVARQATIGPDARVGPFATLAPGGERSRGDGHRPPLRGIGGRRDRRDRDEEAPPAVLRPHQPAVGRGGGRAPRRLPRQPGPDRLPQQRDPAAGSGRPIRGLGRVHHAEPHPARPSTRSGSRG